MEGKLIVLEGPDGVGKSTIAENIKQAFKKMGRPIKLESFPGNRESSLGLLVYKLHHNPALFGIGNIDPAALQLLHVAAHVDLIASTIRPTLLKGCPILLDRYWWSTWVYGTSNGAPAGTIEQMISVEKCFWKPILPSLVILVDREEPFGENVKLVEWLKIREAYRRLAVTEAQKYPVQTVLNKQDIQTTTEYVLTQIMKCIKSQ